ncbi:hypothetical protein A5787_09930 [Mycobacterium sp. 852002-50816_SCH5313054-b]|uniref:hypothetical protein n=1 Tax=Mycobacterium sp. 852002-50816_SCH5313054-b TaxID=1834092 RepID=UPI0007FDD3ED|nr:hypothetical protein [Mycobacterium sp. 852002-50816_SCH5313054-b]OBF47855.1 hypothetical protein A5787_09930 [Mycobacterium sp. 852002-50816_SCH5313054-b]
MTAQSLSRNLIERYLSTSGLRFLRGEHDGEYFCVVNADSGRLHVHLGISPSFGDMLTIGVAPASSFRAADRPWLTRLADTWNKRNRKVTAIVHGCSDPQRVGLVARGSRWIQDSISFEDFASFIDRTIAEAVDLFAEATVVVELPSAAQPMLRDAG